MKLICGQQLQEKEGQSRKGRQVYLGGYDMEEKAARAYDSATLKYWGPSTHINFSLENYQQELEDTKNMTRQEYVAHLRRHHQHGRWQARIGRVAGNKDLYLVLEHLGKAENKEALRRNHRLSSADVRQPLDLEHSSYDVQDKLLAVEEDCFYLPYNTGYQIFFI